MHFYWFRCDCAFVILFDAVTDIIINASFLFVAMHGYRTIFTGWRRTLTFDDIWAIRDEDSSCKIVPAFERSWLREKAKVSVKEVEKYVNDLYVFGLCSTLLICLILFYWGKL